MKWVFPVIWFGILVTVFVIGRFSGQDRNEPQTWLILGIMLVGGLVLFRMLLWDLADEVQDCGSYLTIRRGSVQEGVELSNITDVRMSEFSNPRRLTLRLRTPGPFGDRIVFILKSSFRLNPFVRSAVAEDLIQRIDRIRVQARP